MENSASISSKSTLSISVVAKSLSVQTLAFKAIAYVEDIMAILNGVQNLEDEKTKSLIEYIWAFEAKDVAILLRDSALSLMKLRQFHRDGIRSTDDVEQYKSNLSQTIAEAAHELAGSLEKKYANSGVVDAKWIHQNVPTSAIIAQLDVIVDQIKKIQRSERKLDNVSSNFAEYRKSYIEHMDMRRARGRDFLHGLNQLLLIVEPMPQRVTKEDLKNIVPKIDEFVISLENISMLPSYEHIVLEDISKLRLPVESNAGELAFKNIDVLSEISGWVSFYLDAPLQVVDRRVSAFKDRVIVVLFQLSNRLKAKLDTNDEVLLSTSEISSTVNKLISEYEKEVVPQAFHQLDKLHRDVENLIVTSQFYNKQHNFLPATKLTHLAEYTLRNSLENRYNRERLKKVFSQVSGGVFAEYREEDESTAAGYIDRFLNFEVGNDVNALFLKKGFLGSSFTVVRPVIEAKFTNHYNLWMSGYGGALLVSGGRNSGRSTVIERIPLVFPDMTSHHLVKNLFLVIKGYKHKMTNDLMATLRFITKWQGNDSCIVTIDDLESYTNSSEATFDLFMELSDFIRKHAKKVYFVLVLHKYLERSLRRYFDFEHIFSEFISTDNMNVDLIEKALITRAHAVTDRDDKNFNSDDIDAFARRIARHCHHNIGHAMQLWCMFKNETYDYNINYKFNQEVQRHSRLLITMIKNGSQYIPHLVSKFNEIDARKIRLDIEALVQLRILIRPEEGAVAVNPFLQSTIERILDKN